MSIVIHKMEEKRRIFLLKTCLLRGVSLVQHDGVKGLCYTTKQ